MKLKRIFTFALSFIAAGALSNVFAARGRNIIHVNADVTTHIVMPENLKLVDISTSNIIGNQCADNMVRLKPMPVDSIGRSPYYPDEYLGTVTLIGERHMAQYDIRYCESPGDAQSVYWVDYRQTENYCNPEVSMPKSEMARFAWAVYGSKRKFHNINTRAHGIKASVYNIYSAGNYFFIDFGLDNRTNIEYNIDEIRVTLTDKKETKATNSQTIQISPVFTLNPANKFRKKYRQVLVLDKLTFPEEKTINITITENQISGRQIILKMDYEDVLNADGFDMDKMNQVEDAGIVPVVMRQDSPRSVDQTRSFKNKCTSLERELSNANMEIKRLSSENEDLKTSLAKMEAAYRGSCDTIERILSKDKKTK